MIDAFRSLRLEILDPFVPVALRFLRNNTACAPCIVRCACRTKSRASRNTRRVWALRHEAPVLYSVVPFATSQSAVKLCLGKACVPFQTCSLVSFILSLCRTTQIVRCYFLFLLISPSRFAMSTSNAIMAPVDCLFSFCFARSVLPAAIAIAINLVLISFGLSLNQRHNHRRIHSSS